MSEQDGQTKPVGPSCGTCKFSQFILGQPHRECRRFPPNVFPVAQARGLGFVTQFPMVQPNLKCGEFVPSIMSS